MSDLPFVPLEVLIQVARGHEAQELRGDRLTFNIPQRLRADPEVPLRYVTATLQLEIDEDGRFVWVLPNRVVIDPRDFKRWAEHQDWLAKQADRREVVRLQGEVDDLRAQLAEARATAGWSNDNSPALGGSVSDF